MDTLGKRAALDAISGKPAARPPFLLLTWGFDYIWKCAGIPPWRLARGSFDTWLAAYLATYERHKPDVIIFDGFGAGTQDPIVLDETPRSWIIRDGEGEEWEFIKSSLTLLHRPKPSTTPVSAPRWDSKADIDSNIHGPGLDPRLKGLSAVMGAIGEKALVIPTCVPGYIAACYTLGFSRAMRMMIDDPGLFLHLADRLSENVEVHMRQFAQAGAEAVFITDSWASCDILSPQMFRKFALPYQRKSVDAAKAAGLKAILWNLGDLGPVLADEAALNIDGFAFEQPRKGFEITVSQVREVFGPRRCILGNLDSELLLLRNDPEEIREEVTSQILQSGRGAPFIVSFGSPIPSDAPESAVDATAEAARNFHWDRQSQPAGG